MNGKTVTVQIDTMGNAKVEAHNFTGMSCDAATAPIENALAGSGGLTREVKESYYASETETQEQHMSWS